MKFVWAIGCQNQIMCSGCKNLLIYPAGATSICCALCHAVTPVPTSGLFLYPSNFLFIFLKICFDHNSNIFFSNFSEIRIVKKGCDFVSSNFNSLFTMFVLKTSKNQTFSHDSFFVLVTGYCHWDFALTFIHQWNCLLLKKSKPQFHKSSLWPKR